VALTRPFEGTNRYQVVKPLGEGSFGAVYDVLDRERETRVALKLLTRFDASTLYRFKAEFRTFADVHHPNLVQLHELASDGDDWFFTMELVDGVDWLTFVREGRRGVDKAASTLSPPPSPSPSTELTEQTGHPGEIDRVLACALQLAGAVRALHEADVVHRDIKPSNVLVERSGRVVLVDFGLARRTVRGQEQSTGIGPSGTPAYMAPEQAMGAEPTAAADWYAVGTMIFEAVTGRLPFTGKSLEILTGKQMRDAPRVSDFVAGAPRDLEALIEDLLSRDPAKRPSGERVVEILGAHRPRPAVSAAATARAVDPASAPFVGRKEPLLQLEAGLIRAATGGTVMALVRGTSGIGKSALVRAFIDEMARPRGAHVFSGRCYEREAVSYKAFDSAIDALSRFLVQLPEVEVGGILPRDAAALARVFPVLDRVPTIAQSPRRGLDAVDAQRLRSRAFNALRELFVRLGDRQPFVLFLDDFHWADAESFALLRDLTRGEVTPAMLIVVTFREEAVGRSPPLDALLASVTPEGGKPAHDVVRIDLEPLTVDEARELAAVSLGRASSDSMVETIAGESGGNPFFVGELAQFALTRTDAESRTIQLSSVLQERFATLSDSERRLLEIVAIAGTPLERRVACQAAEIALPDAEPLFRALLLAKLLRTAGNDGGDLLECFHNRIREAIVSPLSDAERRAHHQRLAAALQTLREADPEVLFLHYEAAGVSERAAEYALVSAGRAAEALAFDHAARLYASALALLPVEAGDRNAIMVRMAEALMRAGRGVESADAFLAAVEGADKRDVLAYRHRAAEQLLFCGELDRGLRTMSEICKQVGISIPRSRFKAILLLLALTVVLALRGRRFRARDPATVTAAELIRADVCWSMAGGLSLVDQVIARPFALRAVLAAGATGDADRVVRALATEAGFRSSEGRKARRLTESLFDSARAIGGRTETATTRIFRSGVEGWTKYFLGDYRAAKPMLDAAYVDLTTAGMGIWERDTISIYSLMSRIYLGELKDLADLVEQRTYDARNRSDLFAETNLVASRVNVRWMLDGAPEAKRRDIDQALRRWGQPGRFQIQHWFGLQSHAQLDLYLGEPLSALRRLDDAWPTLKRSFLLRVQNIRVEARSMRAFAAISVAGKGADREEMLAIAERDAAAIEGEAVAWADPIAMLVRAGVARGRGKEASAVAMIEKATGLFGAQGMELHVATAKLWRAAIVGGDEGSELAAEAHGYFRRQGVKEPDRARLIFAPTG
jgi:hypothetical protein